MIGITERFYDSATFKTLLRPSIIVDFDTGAEANLVHRTFIEQYTLKTIFFFIPKLSVPRKRQISPTKIIYVPLIIMDSRRIKRTVGI